MLAPGVLRGGPLLGWADPEVPLLPPGLDCLESSCRRKVTRVHSTVRAVAVLPWRANIYEVYVIRGTTRYLEYRCGGDAQTAVKRAGEIAERYAVPLVVPPDLKTDPPKI